jgi:hypothetical protein
VRAAGTGAAARSLTAGPGRAPERERGRAARSTGPALGAVVLLERAPSIQGEAAGPGLT